MEHEATEPRHPIRVVAQRTGLTPATLRAWERRYGVVEPVRSDGGQRLYSDHDVSRLARLRRLTDAGRAISLVAELPDDEAEALLEEDLAARRGPPPVAATGGAADVVEAAYGFTTALDGDALEACLRRGAVTLGAHPFLENVLAPLLRRVGVAWTREELTPAHEHLCTAVVERVLRWLTEPGPPLPALGRVVVATLPGERHSLGAMLVAATAVLEGWQVTYLGVDLPAVDIALAATDVDADLVALSLVTVESAGSVVDDLAALRRGLPDGTEILLGGAGAGRMSEAALPEGASIVTSLGALRAKLTQHG